MEDRPNKLQSVICYKIAYYVSFGPKVSTVMSFGLYDLLGADEVFPMRLLPIVDFVDNQELPNLERYLIDSYQRKFGNARYPRKNKAQKICPSKFPYLDV